MLRKILAHLAIVFGGMCFVLFVIDAIKGGAMSFINNDITKAFIAILSVLAIVNSVLLLIAQAREARPARRPQPRPAAQPSAARTAARPAARPSVRTARTAAPAARTAPVQRPAAQTRVSRPSAGSSVQRPRSHSSLNR